VPEGDAVRRTARRLDAALAGDELVRAELRVPRFATADLRGATVVETATVGKHLLTRLRREGRELTLHHHLRMDGRWRIGPPGPPRAPSHLIRVWLATAERQAVGMHLHQVEVARTDQERQWIGHLGPDILAADFDVGAAAARVAGSGRPLVESLLDQRLMCGLGTMWASEVAYLAGAQPWSAGPEVAELPAALTAVRRRMLEAVESPRGAARSPLMVFERVGQPCRVCGTPIRSGRVGVAPYDRVTYWCPACQA
jgi:endonuclease-8